MAFDPTLLLMGAVLVVLIIFMVRNSRKRRRDALEMQDKLKTGAEVMTNFGMFGKVKKIDEAENKIVLETSPGQTMTVHRQVIARVIDPTSSGPTKSEAVAKAVADVALNPEKESGKLAIDPQFGERVEKPAAKAKPSTKSPQSGTGKPGSSSNK
jgi:preprotein translocase subunit YajC